MAQEGKLGRNRIAHELSLSQGSVSNILKVWRDGNFDILTLAKPIATEPSLEEQMAEKEIELAELSMNIDSEMLHLEELKKSAEDFAVIKAEMAAAGIGGPDSPKFINVLRTFKECGYSTSRILEASAEVMELEDARENIKQQKQEIEKEREVLDRKLEEIDDPYAFQTVINTLGINLDQLKSAITHLISLEQMGIGVEQIVGICRNLHQNQICRQQWERGSEWNTQGYRSTNNGSVSQEYGYGSPGD